MFSFLPAYIPEIVQVFPFVLVFALACAPSLHRHPMPYYAVIAVAVVLADVLGAAAGTSGMGDASRLSAAAAQGGIVGAWAQVAQNPVGNAVITLLTSSYTGVSIYLIVMFVGVLQNTTAVKRLRLARSELSILGGIIIVAHVARVFYLPFLFANPQFAAVWGPEAAAFMLVATGWIGIPLSVVFLVLWVTSFPPVRRRMKPATWRKVQKWAYLFMALMLAQGFFLALGHAAYVGQLLGSSSMVMMGSAASGMADSFAGYVATATLYAVVAVFYLVLWLQKRALARRRKKQETERLA